MFNTLELELQKQLIEFVKAEQANKGPKPLKETLVAEILRQIVAGDREITGIMTDPTSGDVFVRFSFTAGEEAPNA